MNGITQLGYVGFSVSDLARWEEFAVQVLGMQVGSRDGETGLNLRMDRRDQRVVLQKGTEDDLAFTGWELPSEEALAAFVAKLSEQGFAIQKAAKEQAQKRSVESLYVAKDPNGVQLEFYFGAGVSKEPFKSQVNISEFVTGALGMGHVLLIAKNKGETDAFYRKVMGLKLSDYIRQEVAPGVVIDATFLHVNGRHHTLAFAEVPDPKHINHVMVQVEDMSDVGRAYDRCTNMGVPIVMGLGHHPNDEMFSFYAQSPSGFAVEFGWGGLTIDDENWDVKNYTQLSDWGHRRVAA
ncbi:MAG: glyoxalase [Rhodocyclaceae bacterium]|nr:MAG: glyoxalase [Rhodocyclaceae bacterium]